MGTKLKTSPLPSQLEGDDTIWTLQGTHLKIKLLVGTEYGAPSYLHIGDFTQKDSFSSEDYRWRYNMCIKREACVLTGWLVRGLHLPLGVYLFEDEPPDAARPLTLGNISAVILPSPLYSL